MADKTGFRDRQAIALTPQQPFINWVKEYSDFFEEEDSFKSKTYLIDYNIDDVEKWLKNKFDKFFTLELEEWHDNKKVWPQHCTYKMFNQWFNSNISSTIFDMEEIPISKED